MKTTLAILFATVALCSAEDYITVTNCGAYPFALYTVDDSYQLFISVGQTVYFPRSAVPEYGAFFQFHVDWYASEDPMSPIGSDWVSIPSAPVIVYTINGSFYTIGTWPVSLISVGFTLGLLVSGIMLSLWIARLIRKPVTEA